ncbi:hypothetical protein BDN72DRAFT_830040 [Pluteus cervinus]|uniref:Uncharacterized protein n=1 Tax=Pluteus cervinus TaxID=181527 RepID=A0ACD3BGW9_9AGAR|nr:hypothetical protein BDN72DRAFT_830040 [Pluteus cervinus]
MFNTRLFALALLALPSLVAAHFQLQFPPPRGPFVEDNEPNFCDGYLTPSDNRTTFSLANGFVTLNSEHPKWTFGVLLTTKNDSTSFNDFQQVLPFFQGTGEGPQCIPLNLTASPNATSLTTGEDVTLQFVYDGGDGQLYQCADVILSANATAPSNVTCTNSTATGSAPTPSGTSAGVANFASGITCTASALVALLLAAAL